MLVNGQEQTISKISISVIYVSDVFKTVIQVKSVILVNH